MESDARVAGPKRLPVTTGPDAGEGQTARNVTVPMSFEERRKELEALICEFHHTLWERGLPVPSEAGRAALDQEAFVRDLARKLEGGLAMLPPRRSARTLAGVMIQVAAARLRGVASLAARLSASERSSLATFLRLSEEERRALGTILCLPGQERRELATVLGLSSLECQALAAFLGEPQADLARESGAREQPMPTVE